MQLALKGLFGTQNGVEVKIIQIACHQLIEELINHSEEINKFLKFNN